MVCRRWDYTPSGEELPLEAGMEVQVQRSAASVIGM
jgi:hypothetical protein